MEILDQMKGVMTTDLTDLEKQFLALREQLYHERLHRVEEEINEVRTGKSSAYLQPLEELQENLKNRTEVAAIHRDLKIANIKCIYEAEKVAAKQTMDMECRVIAESIRQDLEEKLKRLEEDRNSLDSELWSDASLAGKKKKKYIHSGSVSHGYDAPIPMIRDQLNLPDRRRKPVTVSGPYVVYMLRENEILEDYNQIRRAARTSYSGSYCYI
jgi:breast cancer metastasis-suppressor 1-like protein